MLQPDAEANIFFGRRPVNPRLAWIRFPEPMLDRICRGNITTIEPLRLRLNRATHFRPRHLAWAACCYHREWLACVPAGGEASLDEFE